MTNIDFYEYGLSQITCASEAFCLAADGIGDIIAGVAETAGVPVSVEPPTIAGTTTEGQTLTETHGTWTSSSSTYAYEWQRCDSAGNNCQPISGATAQTYTLAAADVGSTIRVAETASNSEGAGIPAVSALTAVVQAVPSSGQPSNGGSGAQGSGMPATTTGSPGTTASVSQAQIASLLAQLIPTGKAAKIGALLKHSGYTMNVTGPAAGTLSVQWYALPKGAKLAKHGKAKPVLAASGQATFQAADVSKTLLVRLTAQGKRLLKHAKHLKLSAKGTFAVTGERAVSETWRFGVGR
jgi:hypothetical protein